MGYVHLAGASREAGAGQQKATASLAMIFWDRKLCWEGCFLQWGTGTSEAHRRLCGAELAAAARAHWVVLTCSGIPTRCPNSHGKMQRVRPLVQEASAAGWSERFRLCNGEVNKHRGKPVWKQKLALDKLLSLHSHDASLPAHRFGFFNFFFPFSFSWMLVKTRVT